MAEKVGRMVVKVNREAADVDLEVTTSRQEKLRQNFENESLWPLVNRGPLGTLIYGMFKFPQIFFNHIIMENPKYSLSTIQETMLRSAKWSMKSPLKTLRKSGAFLELLIKALRCSEPFYPIEFDVKTEIGVTEGYWLGPKKYKQRESEATIFYLHGGGYVALSSLIGLTSLCYLLKTLRKRYNKHVRVLAIDYTLAPEGPFPAGLNCVERTYKWLVNSGIAGSKNVFLCGDSAGGGLSLALLQKLYPDKSTTTTRIPLPLGVLLISPWVELSCDSLSYFTNAKFDWISGHLCQFAAEYYIYGKEGNPSRKRNQKLQQPPKINKDIILDWLEKVEDNLDMIDFQGNSRLKRLSLELSKRLSTNSKRLSINSKRLSTNSKRHSAIQKRSSRIYDSHTEKITIDSDETLNISLEEKFKNEKSNTKEENFYRDPLISPLHIPHHILAKFPPLFITYGGKEIFRDDIEMFIQKCIESKRIYTSFDSYDYNENSLDGQHPDVIVEMDEEMVHDYPMFIDVFGKHSKKALDRIVHFIANRIPLTRLPIHSFQSTRSTQPTSTRSARPTSRSARPTSRSARPTSSRSARPTSTQKKTKKSYPQTQSLAESAIKFSTISSSEFNRTNSSTTSIKFSTLSSSEFKRANSSSTSIKFSTLSSSEFKRANSSSTSINSRRLPSVIY